MALPSTHVCRILADTFEAPSRIPDLLRRSGVVVESLGLPTGDYDLGRGALVERKTIADLHLSLQRGRLWAQMGRLRGAARLPYLLVEGHDLDDGPLAPGAIRGACLGVIGQGIALIRTDDASDSALWIGLLASRLQGARPSRDRPVYAQRLKSPPELVPEAMLAAVPGISVTGARALLERFGSVSRVVAAQDGDWLDVRGIGPTRAAALRAAVSEPLVTTVAEGESGSARPRTPSSKAVSPEVSASPCSDRAEPRHLRGSP